jgi:glycosyltransferase involved in cell wall biosynthesis
MNVLQNANKYDIICVSGLDWDHPTMPCTQLHLMRQFAARGHRVFFVNPPLRWLNEFKQTRTDARLRHKLMGWRNGFVQAGPNFYSFTPPPQVPLNRLNQPKVYQAVLRFNQLTFMSALRRALKPFELERPLLWNALEPIMGEAVLGKFNEILSIYHCTDELTGFGTYSPNLLELEKEVIRQSDLVITTSETLRQNKMPYNPHIEYVPNAADVDHFSKALQPLPEPVDLAGIAHPRFGFIGQLEYRFDTELVYQVAKARPDWHFVIIGQVQEGYGENPPLLKLPNVHPIGARPSKDLPAYLRALDVCLIPYKLDKLTAAIYPLKLHEYLAAGKPVLATPLPSLKAFQQVIELVNTPEEFIRRGEHALTVAKDEAAMATRLAVAEKNSWHDRIEVTIKLIDQRLAEKAGAVADPQLLTK